MAENPKLLAIQRRLQTQGLSAVPQSPQQDGRLSTQPLYMPGTGQATGMPEVPGETQKNPLKPDAKALLRSIKG